MSNLGAVLQLLQIPPKSRSADELKRLKVLTSHIQFFQKLTEEHGSDICHGKLCSKMTLTSYEEGQYIFNYNDPGDFFCIILKGKVAVQVPANMNVNSLRRNTLANLRIDKPRTRTVVANLADANLDSELGTSPENLGASQRTIILNEVATLEAGSIFGELSLISHQPRVASVQCKEPTYCAVLSRQDYQDLLGAYEQQKLAEKIAMLASLPLFKGWTQSYLTKQHFYFQETLVHRHQVVFTQGKPALYLYIIKEGEFKVQLMQTYTQLPLDNSNSSNLISRTQRFYKRLEVMAKQLVIKGVGELLGDEEFVREINHTCSCECVSAKGVLVRIKQSDMRFKVNHPETMRFLRAKYETQEKWKSRRLTLLESTQSIWDEPETISTVVTPTRRKASVFKPISPEATFDRAIEFKPRPQTRSSTTVYSDLVIKKLRDASLERQAPEPRAYTPAARRRLRSKPPPNFFVKATTAVIQKYKNRSKILSSHSFAL